MFSIDDLKYWWRSGSFDYALHRRQKQNATRHVTWGASPLHYRPGTSDTMVLEKTLFKPARKREYRFPETLAPSVIFDIGANIGATAVYLASLFPTARIFAFEPEPGNFKLLQKNVESLGLVEAIPFALGGKNGRLPLFPSDDAENFGGFSFYEKGVNASSSVSVEVKSINDFIREKAIDRVDLIKIDTEGAEFDILTHLDPEVLARVTWITGELHGEKDFELMAYLAQWFDLTVKKSMHSRLGSFEALNRH